LLKISLKTSLGSDSDCLTEWNKQDRKFTCDVTLRRGRSCRGNAIETYSEFVSLALGIQHAMHVRHTVISGLSVCLYHISPHYLINSTILKDVE